ncbi:MAG: alpha/beta fold hydrolase [Anaerolineae bacterium]|nr:alpha/beta fold hydrolase [Anaerolineae bacterium]
MTQPTSVSNDFKSDVTQLTWPLKIFVAALNGLDRIAPQVSTRLLLSKFVQPRRKKECNYESRLPAGAQRLAVQYNNLALTGWVWGGNGPSVLVMHGWESHTGRMTPLIKPLVAQGYRVFALDAPGHGLSPQVPTHLQDVSAAIGAMLSQHGPFYGVIAHSFGAAATAVCLARHPELMPEKVVLLSPMRDLAQHLDIFAGIAQLSPERKTRLKALVAQRPGLSFEACSAVAAVRHFATPGLIIHDQDDRLIPHAVGQEIAQNWAGAQFVSTSRLGHRRGLGNAQVIGHIVGYLAGETERATAVAASATPAPHHHENRAAPRISLGLLRRATAVS